MVRAFTPWPGTFTTWGGRTLKILSARPGEGALEGKPGTVVGLDDSTVAVITGSGALEVQNLQLEGRRAVSATEFVQGRRDFIGSTLGT
jgi:methionyl-tRNA formyltransferase